MEFYFKLFCFVVFAPLHDEQGHFYKHVEEIEDIYVDSAESGIGLLLKKVLRQIFKTKRATKQRAGNHHVMQPYRDDMNAVL